MDAQVSRNPAIIAIAMPKQKSLGEENSESMIGVSERACVVLGKKQVVQKRKNGAKTQPAPVVLVEARLSFVRDGFVGASRAAPFCSSCSIFSFVQGNLRLCRLSPSKQPRVISVMYDDAHSYVEAERSNSLRDLVL